MSKVISAIVLGAGVGEYQTGFPDEGEVVHVSMNPELNVTLWVMHDEEADEVERTFFLEGAGRPLPDGVKFIRSLEFSFEEMSAPSSVLLPGQQIAPQVIKKTILVFILALP